MSRPKLILQPGKTYVTNSGEHITLEHHKGTDDFFKFKGSNGYYYGDNGSIFEQKSYSRGGYSDDISHELTEEPRDCPECSPERTVLLDILEFKQKSNGIKRKITLKDYSDDSVEIIFKTKFSEGDKAVTTGIRLSYDAAHMLYNSLEYMLEQNQHEIH